MKPETHPESYITPIVLGDSLPNGEQCNRLTKLEHFSSMAMQALLTNEDIGNLTIPRKVEICQDSVSMAIELIKALNRTDA